MKEFKNILIVLIMVTIGSIGFAYLYKHYQLMEETPIEETEELNEQNYKNVTLDNVAESVKQLGFLDSDVIIDYESVTILKPGYIIGLSRVGSMVLFNLKENADINTYTLINNLNRQSKFKYVIKDKVDLQVSYPYNNGELAVACVESVERCTDYIRTFLSTISSETKVNLLPSTK